MVSLKLSAILFAITVAASVSAAPATTVPRGGANNVQEKRQVARQQFERSSLDKRYTTCPEGWGLCQDSYGQCCPLDTYCGFDSNGTGVCYYN
ncbi:hypothetical protein BCR43DRAFT_490346 [Syncephalastrum racemosum]|uniref:Granulins domain-containing protein n=1 Tax=Syncephalastrum racemosum TaxID=13706 RepID=A0A1X2HFU9_SYNRA|nr:hypothetical protein BCR43DRAFT_490346 [Syncephalastrum racemosum]